jgi:membrane protein implicated in regulation of membrane protease activity
MKTSMQIALLLVAAAILAPNMVLAYGGPGSVISGIGALLAAVVALLASLFGFIWFPLKRLYRSVTEEDDPNDEVVTNQTGE